MAKRVVDARIATVGVKRLHRDLRKMVPGAEKEARAIVREGVRLVETEAQRRAPVRTGRLRASIKGSAAGMRGTVYSRLIYAPPHEFGAALFPHRGGVGAKATKGRRDEPARPQRPTTVKASRMIYGALDAKQDDVGRSLLAGFRDLARKHGFH